MPSSLPAAPPSRQAPDDRPPPPAPGGAPVAVSTEVVGGVEEPRLLLRQGRLWLVREAAALVAATDRERWRVTAAPGPGEAAEELVLVRHGGDRWELEGSW